MPVLKHYAIIAITGPKPMVREARRNIMEHGKYNKVVVFPHTEDYGDYPDTTGYEDENWEQIELLNEDSALYKYMLKCIDAVDDYIDKKYKRMCDMFSGDVEKVVHWPKTGGPLFFVTGHVTVDSVLTN